jgi:glutamine synthetase
MIRGPPGRRPPRNRERARVAAALEGNAYASDAERFPRSLRAAIAALEEGTMARAAFGDDVVDHYLNYARTEQALYDSVVTDWERERLFERG